MLKVVKGLGLMQFLRRITRKKIVSKDCEEKGLRRERTNERTCERKFRTRGDRVLWYNLYINQSKSLVRRRVLMTFCRETEIF
jgi:hypothetical protein